MLDIESHIHRSNLYERWGAGVETQKNVRGEIGGWGRVPFNENYAPHLLKYLYIRVIYWIDVYTTAQ